MTKVEYGLTDIQTGSFAFKCGQLENTDKYYLNSEICSDGPDTRTHSLPDSPKLERSIAESGSFKLLQTGVRVHCSSLQILRQTDRERDDRVLKRSDLRAMTSSPHAVCGDLHAVCIYNIYIVCVCERDLLWFKEKHCMLTETCF